MSSTPLVSVVTPNYNYEGFIAETIHSVLRQDYPNIEYIVVDDGSTDNSIKIINKILDENPGSFQLIQQENSGQSSALNNGFEKSKGEILCWLNSDDLLEPSAISIAVDYLNRHPDIDMVFGERIDIDKKGNIINKPIVSFRGLPIFENEIEDFKVDLEDQIEQICKTFSLNNTKQEKNFIEKIKLNCRKIFKEKIGKKPYTNVNLARV